MAKRFSILLGLVAVCVCFAGLSITSLAVERLNQPFSILSSFSWLYWIGVTLFFLSVIQALKEDKFSHLFMIVFGSLILWAVPVFTFSSAYGRDAYIHWRFVRQLSDSGYVEMGSSNDYLNQHPMTYIFGTTINHVLGLNNETVFLRFLVYFRIIPIVLFPIFFYLFTSAIIDDPKVSFLTALLGILGNVFVFSTHYSPLAISASTFLPILFFLSFKYEKHSARNPIGKTGRNGFILLLVIFSAMVCCHFPTTIIYVAIIVFLVLLLPRYRKLPYLLFIAVFLAYSLTVATYGFGILVNFLRNVSMVVMGTRAPMLFSTFGAYIYPWVSWIRRLVSLIFLVPASCITLWHIYKRSIDAIEVMFLGSFSFVLLSGSTQYGEYATRALFLIIPFSAILVFNYMKGALHRFKGPRMLLSTVCLIFFLFLSTLTVSCMDAGERTMSASELEGLRFLGKLVAEGETIVSASSELTVFVNTTYYSNLTLIRNYGQMSQGSMIVFQRSGYWYYFLHRSQQRFFDYIDIAINESDKIFDSTGLVVFRKVNEKP